MQNKPLKQEDEALLEAISPIVNELIDRNYENSQDKIAKQIAPLIGVAIREQIKNQKDEVVDALYPVLGNMISRYVTKTFEEMLETINAQIQSGLSAKAIKRKIQAKVQGVSETELLLRESAGANIRAMLLIHKETGTVLTLAENPDSPISEPEMLASMMSAIQSFVNDWVTQNEENHELGEIEFGGSKIIIESSGYAFLAVITEGGAYASTYESIRRVLESIVVDNGDDIREFNGDLSSFPNIEIYQKISTLMDSKKHEVLKTKKHPLIYILPIFLLIFFAWNIYEKSLDDALVQRVNETLYKTPQLTNYRIQASLDDEVIYLSGEVPFKYHKDLAQTKVLKVDGVKKIQNSLVVVPTLDDPMQISSNISYLLAGFNISNNLHVRYSYDYPTLHVEGILHTQEDKEKLLIALSEIDGVDEIDDKLNVEEVVVPKVIIPDITTTIYFKNGSSSIDIAQESKLISLISILSKLDENLTLHVDGYSDSSGSKNANSYITKKRALNVLKYLKDSEKVPQNIIADGNDKPPLGVDTIKMPEKARCVIIRWKK